MMKVRALAVYRYGRDYALGRGIIIADTKFEFGIVDGEPIVIDEVLTPDSSRFWPADQYGTGRSQPSFDKQLSRLPRGGWNKAAAARLPSDVVEGTAEGTAGVPPADRPGLIRLTIILAGCAEFLKGREPRVAGDGAPGRAAPRDPRLV
jgi:hypothetical protein